MTTVDISGNWEDKSGMTVLYNVIWHSCWQLKLKYSFKYNQQDASLYIILYYCQCSICTYQMLCVQCLSSRWWAERPPEFQLNHASGSSKQAWHIPDAVCTVLSSSITKGLDATGIHRHPENVTMEIIHDGHSKERSGNCITNAGFLSLE